MPSPAERSATDGETESPTPVAASRAVAGAPQVADQPRGVDALAPARSAPATRPTRPSRWPASTASAGVAALPSAAGGGRVEQRRRAPGAGRQARAVDAVAAAAGALELAPDDDAARRRRSCPPAASRRARAPRRCPAPRPAARPCRRSARRRCARGCRCPAPRPRARPPAAGGDLRRALGVARAGAVASIGAGADQAPPTARAASTRKRPPWYCEKTAVMAPPSSTATVAPPTFSDASVPASMRSVAWIAPPTTRARPQRAVRPVGLQEGDDAVRAADGRGRRRDVARADVERRRRAPRPAGERRGPDAGLAARASRRRAAPRRRWPRARPGATASAAVTTGPAPAPASIGAAGSHAACAGARERSQQRRRHTRTARSDTLRKRRIGDLSVVRAPSLSSTTAAGSPLRSALAAAPSRGARTCNCTPPRGPRDWPNHRGTVSRTPGRLSPVGATTAAQTALFAYTPADQETGIADPGDPLCPPSTLTTNSRSTITRTLLVR